MQPKQQLAPEFPAFGPRAFAQATGASTQAIRDLEQFEQILTAANAQLNLVGPSALTSFWLRHAYDSAQLLSYAPQARVWADLGAGAGFPGVVLAILLKETPGVVVHLIDSLTKRTRFLSSVTADLNLPATVHTGRAEKLPPPHGLDVVTARACAPLPRLLTYARPYFEGGATGLFLKGRSIDQELKEARRSWVFQAVLHQSHSDPSGRIVQIQGLARA